MQTTTADEYQLGCRESSPTNMQRQSHLSNMNTRAALIKNME